MTRDRVEWGGSGFARVPRLRAERLIAGCRVVLSASALFGVWLDPAEPATYASVVYGLLLVYVLYAIVLAVVVWRGESGSRVLAGTTHALDLAFFSLFIFFTSGPASPFTVYFVFAVICATLRWQARGTLWTSVVTLSVFSGSGIYFSLVLRDPTFDLRAFIIRGVYLAVLAVLLGSVAVHGQRTLREMWLLASWPRTISHDVEALVRDLLGHAEPLLDAPRAVLAWTEDQASWRRVATWNHGRCTYEQQPIRVRLVSEGLERLAFIFTSHETPRSALIQELGAPRLSAWPGDPLEPAFAGQLAARTVISVPLHGESFEGRLFLLDKPDPILDDLLVAEIMAGVVTARLDAFQLTERLRHAAANEERIRLARDLHDGVLQAFTGVALRLAAARGLLATDREAAMATLAKVQGMLASEHRELRFLIEELKPGADPGEEMALPIRLGELVARIEREWDINVELKIDVPDTLPPAIVREVYHLVREGLVNAARHSGASAAAVVVETAATGTISISITDNGRGFAFSGRYSGEDLARLNLGPRSLRERVLAMNGSLTLDSASTGVRLDLQVPAAVATT